MQVALGAGGESDPEAEGGVWQTLFVDIDDAVGIGEPEQSSGVQTARAAAEDGDPAKSHDDVASAGNNRSSSEMWSGWSAGTTLV